MESLLDKLYYDGGTVHIALSILRSSRCAIHRFLYVHKTEPRPEVGVDSRSALLSNLSLWHNLELENPIYVTIFPKNRTDHKDINTVQNMVSLGPVVIRADKQTQNAGG